MKRLAPFFINICSKSFDSSALSVVFPAARCSAVAPFRSCNSRHALTSLNEGSWMVTMSSRDEVQRGTNLNVERDSGVKQHRDDRNHVTRRD